MVAHRTLLGIGPRRCEAVQACMLCMHSQGRDRTHQSSVAIPSVFAVALSTRKSTFPTLRCSRCGCAVGGWRLRRCSTPSSSCSGCSWWASVACHLGPLFLLASARVVPRLRSWLSRWLPGPPGVGSRFALVLLVVLVSSFVFGMLVYAAFVDFAEIWYFGRLAAFSVLWVSASRRDLRGVVSTFAASSFPPGGHSRSFCCTSQVPDPGGC